MILLLLSLTITAATPVSECPDATILSLTWGRLLMYDLTDNGLLDASFIYGLNQSITNALLSPYATPPYMSLSPSGYLPRLCNASIPRLVHSGCSSDDSPCCGDSRCSESPEMQTLVTLLVREHNAYAAKLNMNDAGHEPHVFTLARNHIISILASTCPGCRGPTPLCSAGVSNDLLKLLSYTYNTPPPSTQCNSAGVIICDDDVTARLETPLVKITPPNATITDALNFSYYLDVTDAPYVLSLDASVLAFFNSYYTVDHNATALLVFLLAERHGPGEEDIIGRLGHALMQACTGVANPVWINTASVRKIIAEFYTATCNVECTLDSTLLAGGDASSSSSGGDKKVQEGSLIFFVVMMGVLVVAFFVLVMYKLFT